VTTSFVIAAILVLIGGVLLRRKMALADVIRKIAPMRFRQTAMVWVVLFIMRWRWVYLIFYWVLFGIWLKEKVTVWGGLCLVEYKGKEIIMSRDGIMSYLEIFYDEIYDVLDSPQLGDIVLDVGAYVGMYSIKASEAVGESGIVVAIEPNDTNLRQLRQNIVTYQLANVTVSDKAAAAHSGVAPLYLTKSNFCHSLVYPTGSREIVKVDSLDNITRDLGLKKVDLIKIDAEGAELEILEGCQKLFQQENIRLVIAAYHDLPNGGAELPHLVEYLERYGFHTEIYKGQYIYARKEKA